MPEHVPESLAEELGDAFPHLNVLYQEEMVSTSTLATQLAREGSPEGTLVVTDQQAGGRGRLGRSWFSLPGKSLLFSIVLRPLAPPDQASSLSLVVALALAQALERQGLKPAVKWPNDLLLNEKKVAGILLESSLSPDQVQWIVAGLGVNLNYQTADWPTDLVDRTTSVEEITGQCQQRGAVLRSVLEEFTPLYDRWKTSGFTDSLREAWLRRMVWRGCLAELVCGKRTIRGVIAGVDQKGALLVQTGDQIERVMWGEGSLVVRRDSRREQKGDR